MKLLTLIFMFIMLPVMAFAQVVLPGSVDGEIDYSKVVAELIANPKGLPLYNGWSSFNFDLCPGLQKVQL
jgi:hypothetical protein